MGVMNKNICKIVGHTNLKRRYFNVTDTWRCSKCKDSYDTELLGTHICPECKREMKHPKAWTMWCTCGYNQE